jgi:hypothetical protein
MAGSGIFVIFVAFISVLNIARRLVYVIFGSWDGKIPNGVDDGIHGLSFSFGFIASVWLAATLRRAFPVAQEHMVGYFSRQHSWKPQARGRLLGAQLLWRQFIDLLLAHETWLVHCACRLGDYCCSKLTDLALFRCGVQDFGKRWMRVDRTKDATNAEIFVL